MVIVLFRAKVVFVCTEIKEKSIGSIYKSTCTSEHHIQTPCKFSEYYYPPAGVLNISNNMNSLIFKAVQDFIAQSGRFAME